ncbi:hypothetical protein VE03_10409 [Pseudogymnoascus sp. 23342-1-I1]|nr:hypothetical protein VE03_10409 [Pseudogymnoascus sp. 23342-1-I1]
MAADTAYTTRRRTPTRGMLYNLQATPYHLYRAAPSVRLQREEDRLVAAGAVAEEQAMAAHRLADEAHRSIVRARRSANEAISRMRRIRLQQKLLKERGGEMLRRGLATLDELDEVEREERGEVVAASSSEHAARTASASEAALDLLSMPSPYWDQFVVGADGGTSSPAQS